MDDDDRHTADVFVDDPRDAQLGKWKRNRLAANLETGDCFPRRQPFVERRRASRRAFEPDTRDVPDATGRVGIRSRYPGKGLRTIVCGYCLRHAAHVVRTTG